MGQMSASKITVSEYGLNTAPTPPYELGRELWPVVRAQMLGRSVASEELGQNLEHVVGSDLSSHLDRHTLPRVLVEHGSR